jgi:hypothetical protein
MRGDILVLINDASMRGGETLAQLLRTAKAGQPFTALIERDGGSMTLNGNFGIRLSVTGKCVVATPERLETAQAVESVPFTLIVNGPEGDYDFECVEGCAPGSVSTGGASSDSDQIEFSLRYGPNGLETVGPGGSFPDSGPGY